MEVLYVSKLISKHLEEELFQRSGVNPGFAVQKFSRLLARGFVLNNVSCSLLSSIPLVAQKSLYLKEKTEKEDDIVYHYIPSIRIPFFRHIVLVLYTFFYILFKKTGLDKNRYVICDVLDVSISLGCIIACKLKGISAIGIMTDMPGLMVGGRSMHFKKYFINLNLRIISLFNGYVFLTEQMNQLINKKKHPYIIMEGLVDSQDNCINNIHIDKKEKILLYAGGIHKRYGLKMLVDSFVSANIPHTKLIIYGSGPYVSELKLVCKLHSNVEYKGVASNQDIIKAEKEATLLLNPRPTNEEFTKYSFPSKNMEYMKSGTPVLTTKLPGMPLDYYDYIYVFEEETVDAYTATLKKVLSLSSSELEEKGKRARLFVTQYKNNRVQCERIINLMKITSKQ